jgi:pimeloyl-ACP methyl ester carboxylesterase
MDAATRRIRLIDVAGAGATVLLLRGSDKPSAVDAIMAQHFRIVRLALDQGDGAMAARISTELVDLIGSQSAEPVGLIADATTADAALAFAAARPELLSALALVAPAVPTAPLPDFKTPVIALFGTRDAPPHIGRRMREMIATCHVMFVYDASHAMADERPEATAAALREFMIAGDRFLVTGRSGKLYP